MPQPTLRLGLPRRLVTPLVLLGFVVGAAPLSAPAHAQPGRLNRHTSIHDAAHARTLIYGGYDNGNAQAGLWELTFADTLAWRLLSPAGPAPPARFSHTATHVPDLGQMVVFGGTTGGLAVLDDVWTLALDGAPTWMQAPVAPGPAPEARLYHTAVYDSRRQRIVVFGGQVGSGLVRGDVWALQLGDTLRWEQVLPRGAITARYGHSAIYDSTRDRMVVFAGLQASNARVYELTFADTTWRDLNAQGDGSQPPGEQSPPQLSGHSATYFASGDRMVVFGGFAPGGIRRNQVWALALSGTPAWRRLSPAGLEPSERVYHSASLDVANQVLMIYSGDALGADLHWGLALEPNPLWSPARPVLTISASHIDLPTVTVGDTVSAPLLLANWGLDPLHVEQIRLPSDEFSLSAPPPLRLTWRTPFAETVRLDARDARAVQDSLVVWSDDVGDPRKRVTLGIDVRPLDFTARVLGNPDEVRLHAPFVVVATPANGVDIERAVLYYRPVGQALFDSLEFTPLAADLLALVPPNAVTETGVECVVRAENPPFVSTRSFTQAVMPPTGFMAVPQPTAGSDFLMGQAIDVAVQIPEGALFVGGTIHFIEVGADTAGVDSLREFSLLGVPVGRIPAHVVGARGVQYWIELETLSSQLRYPDGRLPATIATRIPSLLEEVEHPGSRYRLLSVPLDFGEGITVGLGSILTDQFGPYDRTAWRAYRYDPDSLRNLEHPHESLALAPGRAFWLITRDAHRVDTAPIDGYSTMTIGTGFPVELAPGWNAIGNPFVFPVAWDDVARDPAVGDPVAFDPALGVSGDYSPVTPATLQPFEGYFVENTSAAPTLIFVPARARGTTGGAETARVATETAARAWTLGLAARTANASDDFNVLGASDEALDAFDPLDQREPPLPPGPWVRLSFANSGWSERPGHYRRDLRSASGSGHAWEVEVRSAERGEPVTIDLAAPGPLPAGTVVRVLDREQGGVVEAAAPGGAGDAATAAPLARLRIVSFGPDRPYRLTVVAGAEDYVARAVAAAGAVPTAFALDPPAPNPFRLGARVRFGLPRAARVTVEVFGLSGERVIRLADRAFDPGYHSLVWDGATADGAAAPSGVYWVRVTASGEVKTSRLVRVR